MFSFSIIIPVKPGGFVAACHHLSTIMADSPDYEILLAEGCAPSRQRNLAAGEASGDILYFLDDDSLITRENLAFIAEEMANPAVAVVGGPSITPPTDSRLQQLFGCALASFIGSGAVQNRYRQQGKTRDTSDKELILCNLAVRRSVFMALGGFNECLYPNEENEFLERVISAGYRLIHNPAMLVYRSQRKTLKAFVHQMFSYGRGRGQQTLISSSFSVTSFVPLFFVVYLVLLLTGIKYVLLLLPLMVYVILIVAGSLLTLSRTRNICSLLLPGIFPLMHIANGMGLLWGLTQGKPVSVSDSFIQIRRIKDMGQSSHAADCFPYAKVDR